MQIKLVSEMELHVSKCKYLSFKSITIILKIILATKSTDGLVFERLL